MDYVTIILGAAKAAGVSGAILLAICSHETGLKNITIQEDGGSPTFGICQVKAETAKMLGFSGKPQDLLKPTINAKYAALYLKYQLERYGNFCMAVAAYNSGKYNESKKMPGFPRNLRYVLNVKKKLDKKLQNYLTCNSDYAMVNYAE